MAPLRAADGREVQLLPDALQALRLPWRGQILAPDSPGYDEARAVWNGMIDRRPGLILRCADAGDVQRAVRFASEHQLLVAVRGGGHHIAGNAVCDGGVQIDLSLMRAVTVDPVNRTATVQPGCTLADFDRVAQEHGLAVPLGINSTTGVAGLTLGGGFGWLTRKHGLTVDNLISAEIVTASGDVLQISETQHPDLFWAIRGGGGNFGVVTRFEFRLHPVGPQVLTAIVVHPLENAREVLRFYREFTTAAPDDVCVIAVMRKAPPLPFLPVEWHGRDVVILPAFYAGADHAEGLRLLEPLGGFGNPIGRFFGPNPYVGWQQAFDALLTPGARNYWKSHDFIELNDRFLDIAVEYAARLPSDQSDLFIAQLGGAASRVPAGATAYASRDVRYILNVHGRWEGAQHDIACIAWARELFGAAARYATGSVYVNFMTMDETERVAAAYGPNYQRLEEVKGRYDPRNLFRMNQNIRPALTATPRS